MGYVKSIMSLSNIMEKALKCLDKDHIHYMTGTGSAMPASKIVNLMKSYTTSHICEKYPVILENTFGKSTLSGQMDILLVV